LRDGSEPARHDADRMKHLPDIVILCVATRAWGDDDERSYANEVTAYDDGTKKNRFTASADAISRF
jgi:hypothetical protein